MKVSEIFFSIQGEGINVGKTSIFVRLAGCNLSCSWCDTKYAYEGDEMSIEEVKKEIKKVDCNHIVWTGGEPALQIENVRKITQDEEFKDYTNEIETNGTVYFNPLDFDIVNVSPKRQAINVEVLRKFVLANNTFFKFVVESKENFNIWKNIIRELKIPNERVILMPEGITDEKIKEKALWLIEICKIYNYRFSPRIQVWAYGTSRGV